MFLELAKMLFGNNIGFNAETLLAIVMFLCVVLLIRILFYPLIRGCCK